MNKTGLLSGVLCIALLVSMFVFADSPQRWYGGIFFAFTGALLLVTALLWRRANLPVDLSWHPYRFPNAGFEGVFPCKPTHTVTAPALRPDWDVRQHLIVARVAGCDIRVDKLLIKWRSIPPDDPEMPEGGLEFGELPPWEKRAAAAALEDLLSAHGHPAVRPVSSKDWPGEILFRGPIGIMTARFAWRGETIFSGGSSWTVAAITGDADVVERFFRDFKVLPSDWLQEEWRQWRADRSESSDPQ